MALITCPDCQHQLSSDAKACPNCGLPARKISRVAPSAIENSTLFQEETGSVGQRIAAGIGCFFIGLIVCLIPVVGWIVGPLMIIASPFIPFALSGKDIGSRQGDCPYCLQPVTFSDLNKTSYECTHCKQQVIVKNRRFHTLASLHSQSKPPVLPQANKAQSLIRVAKNGEDIGTHTLEKIDSWLQSGFLSQEDYYWDESYSQWRQLKEKIS